MDASERTRIAGRRRDVTAALVTAAIVLFTAFASWQSWQAQQQALRTQHDLQALLACQARVNDELRHAALARDADGTEQLQAQLDLLSTPPGDRAAGLAALGRFRQQLIETLANRAANPFPTRNC